MWLSLYFLNRLGSEQNVWASYTHLTHLQGDPPPLLTSTKLLPGLLLSAHLSVQLLVSLSSFSPSCDHSSR